jgi:hypothetical protein
MMAMRFQGDLSRKDRGNSLKQCNTLQVRLQPARRAGQRHPHHTAVGQAGREPTLHRRQRRYARRAGRPPDLPQPLSRRQPDDDVVALSCGAITTIRSLSRCYK